MKRLLVFPVFLIAFSSFAQSGPVSSNCNAPDSIIRMYRADAQRNALSRVYSLRLKERNDAQIPEIITDTLLRAMLAVYNVNGIPERDTVIDIYKLHSRPYQGMDTFSYTLNYLDFQVDKSQQWVIDLSQKKFPTANTQVNDLMTKYNLKDPWVSTYGNFMSLHSDSNYNMPQIAKEWLNIPGVYQANGKSGWIGDGSFLIGKVYPTFVDLIYSYGWMDCPSGCIYRRNWAFRVLNDCSVYYMYAWDGKPELHMPDPGPYIDPIMTVYPNPFTEYIEIAAAKNYDYSVYDLAGCRVKQGQLKNSIKIQLTDIEKGMYILYLQNGRDIRRFPIVKN